MVTPALVKQYAPELNGLMDARVQLYINLAGTSVAESFFGSSYDMALAMLTCHYLTMAGGAAGQGQTPGPIASKSVGDLSVSYGSMDGWKGESSLRTTEYGRIYLHIRSGIPHTPVVGGC